MSGSAALGLLLALGSAVALNWGYLAQHSAANRVPPLSLRRPLRSLRSLFASPRWLVGFLVGLGGWGLYAAALVAAPLSLVQAVAAGGIGLLALLASRGGATLSRREVAGAALGVAGLALLGASLAGGVARGTSGSVAAVSIWIGVSAAAAAFAAGPAARRLAHGSGLGIAAGLLYSAGDVATKVAVQGGGRLVLVPVVLALHGLAFVALQLGFQRGGPLSTAGVATLLTNALPIAGGAVLFQETLPGGPLGALRLLAFAAVVAAAAALANVETGTGRSNDAAARTTRSPMRRTGYAGAALAAAAIALGAVVTAASIHV